MGECVGEIEFVDEGRLRSRINAVDRLAEILDSTLEMIGSCTRAREVSGWIVKRPALRELLVCLPRASGFEFAPCEAEVKGCRSGTPSGIS